MWVTARFVSQWPFELGFDFHAKDNDEIEYNWIHQWSSYLSYHMTTQSSNILYYWDIKDSVDDNNGNSIRYSTAVNDTIQAMFPLIFKVSVRIKNILPALVWIWNDVYEICANTFLHGTFMCAPSLHVRARLITCVCLEGTLNTIVVNITLRQRVWCLLVRTANSKIISSVVSGGKSAGQHRSK